jgi:hypothetical protein
MAPLLLAQRIGPDGRIRLSALFQYLRRQLRRDPATPDPLVDLAGPYVAVVLISAGAANVRGPGYFAGVVALTAWVLFALRPRGAAPVVFAALIAASAGAGYAGHVGLARLQLVLEAWVDDWLLSLPNDSERLQTRIGSIGRLKEHDSIALRLYAPERLPEQLRLLHTASFNEYRGGAWFARDPVGDSSSSGEAIGSATVILRVQGGRALLPLPPGALEVVGLSGLAVSESRLGVVATDTQRGWLRYEFGYGARDTRYAPPGPQDLALPPVERDTLERLAAELGLKDGNAIAGLERHFGAFAYSTFRERAAAPGLSGLEDFLLVSKSGHCEYFAVSTTLLLRAAGIPARYATGYAAIERSRLEDAWVVRARHAHAWTRAWIDGRWVDVDLTPAGWPVAEAGLVPA